MKNSKNLTISICIAAYNNLSSLSVALESICLQNYPNLEILISDDHSPNSVKPVFDQWTSKYPNFRWRYHYQEKNLGVAQNQAWLLRNATGHLMTFFQHDDYLIDPNFYVKVIDHYVMNSTTKVYVANAVLQSPLSGEPLNKSIFPRDSKNQDFKVYNSRKFLKYLTPTICRASVPISWSSLVFEIDSAIKVGAFSDLYLTDANRGKELNTFTNEESGIFLSLLNDRFAFGFSKKLVTYRGVLDSSFSQQHNNPSTFLVHANNIEVLNLLKGRKLATSSITRSRMLVRAVSIGLNTDNEKVREFLGTSMKDRMLMTACLLSGRFIARPLSPVLLKKDRFYRLLYLVLKQPNYFKRILMDRLQKYILTSVRKS